MVIAYDADTIRRMIRKLEETITDEINWAYHYAVIEPDDALFTNCMEQIEIANQEILSLLEQLKEEV